MTHYYRNERNASERGFGVFILISVVNLGVNGHAGRNSTPLLKRKRRGSSYALGFAPKNRKTPAWHIGSERDI